MGRAWTRLRAQIRKHLVGIAAAAAMGVLVLLGHIEWLELRSLDLLFELRRARQPAAPIVIVTIDESTFQELDIQWPFPRAMHGKLIDRISAGRPLAIGVDLIFDRPSREPADDEALGAALARARNVVIGFGIDEDVQPLYGLEKSDLGVRREASNLPVPVIRDGAAAIGVVNVRIDPDSHLRRMPVSMRGPDASWPSFDAQLHSLVTAAGLPTQPLPGAADFLINFRGEPKTFPWFPYYRVVNGEIPSSAFAGKIVLIGPTSEKQKDTFPTAFSHGDMPGVEIHANALDTLIRGDRIRELPESVSTVLAIVGALVGSALVVRLRAMRALVAVVGVSVVIALGTFGAFAYSDVWMRSMAGTFALALGYGATVVESFIREQRERRRLSLFFSKDVVRTLMRERDEGSLGSSRRVVTVLFSDIRGFTSLSEKLSPEQVSEMVLEYLTEMTDIVERNGGIVDKYIGDCVMALYNAPVPNPEHAANAIRTGLELQERTLGVAARWEAKLGLSIRSGVGINTGEAVVGFLGSRKRPAYTAIGDAVNLAARLEPLTKDYGASIIISEFTHELVKGRFPTRELGEVTVKGKSLPVKIFGVMPASMRKRPRAVLEAAATLTAVGDGRVCRVRTVDISEVGLALTGVPPEWDVGTKIQIRVDGGELSRRIIAEGAIVSRRGDAAGVQFTSVDEDSAPAVAEFVARGRETSPDDR